MSTDQNTCDKDSSDKDRVDREHGEKDSFDEERCTMLLDPLTYAYTWLSGEAAAPHMRVAEEAAFSAGWNAVNATNCGRLWTQLTNSKSRCLWIVAALLVTASIRAQRTSMRLKAW